MNLHQQAKIRWRWCTSDRSDGDESDANDNCILVPNPNQANLDDDAQGDACDGDIYGDNVQTSNSLLERYQSRPVSIRDATGKDNNQDGCIDEAEP